eukprot:scaffold2470_cov114-Cylindrotheca_fusiformis.AAC.3
MVEIPPAHRSWFIRAGWGQNYYSSARILGGGIGPLTGFVVDDITSYSYSSLGVWGLKAPNGFKGQSSCGEKLLAFEEEGCADDDSLFWVNQSVMVRVIREACHWKMMSLKELCPAKHAHQESLQGGIDDGEEGIPNMIWG